MSFLKHVRRRRTGKTSLRPYILEVGNGREKKLRINFQRDTSVRTQFEEYVIIGFKTFDELRGGEEIIDEGNEKEKERNARIFIETRITAARSPVSLHLTCSMSADWLA